MGVAAHKHLGARLDANEDKVARRPRQGCSAPANRHQTPTAQRIGIQENFQMAEELRRH